MRQLIRPSVTLAFAIALASAAACRSASATPRTEPVAPAAAAAATDQPVNRDAAVLAEFQKRIEAYRKLHDEVAKGAAEMKTTDDPARIRQAETLLAERLRAARTDAKPGDIFTPEIRGAFRKLMYSETHGAAGRDTKAAIREDAPAGVPLKVNASYPADEPRPTVPANLLASLPRLPKDLEYRVIQRHLVLLDVDANLIVDFIPNAIH